ncbi:hypothetical protein QFZ66_008402 [Streptomyces sp. B4I13]|nr:hypothetical protein [Streptomyces sp. B4I13]
MTDRDPGKASLLGDFGFAAPSAVLSVACGMMADT